MKAAPVDSEPGIRSSQIRKEISQMLQDAGFRSDIDSDLRAPDLGLHSTKQSLESIKDGRESLPDDEDDEGSVESPTFMGFPSSPPSVGSVRHGGDESGSRNSTPEPDRKSVV